jgi:hypothetical protein
MVPMETIVIARNRFRMYTAFITPDGRRILNIADRVDGVQQCVSIGFDEADEAALRDEDQATIQRLLATGARLPQALPTPSCGVPVSNLGYLRAA